MTDKELKKLSRAELLELLLVQTRETEKLQKKLAQAEEALQDRNLQVQQAGDLAQAVLQVNGVMEAAQEAASQYLDNIRAMEEQAKDRCARMMELAEAEANKIRENARQGMELPDTDQVLQEIYRLLEE